MSGRGMVGLRRITSAGSGTVGEGRAGPPAWTMLEVIFLLAVTLLAALLRLPGLDVAPPGLHGDEADLGLEALRILEEGWIGVWSHTALGQPAAPFYWTALWFLFLEPSQASVRFTMAILAVAAIPAFYLFCREWYGRRAAIMGVLLLSVSFWHIYYSRIGYPLNALPVLLCGGLYALGRGMRTGGVVPLFVAGLLLGLSIYTYASFIFFGVALGAALVLLVWRVAGRPATRWTTTRRVALTTGVALVVASPFFLFALNEPEEVAFTAKAEFITSTDEYGEAESPGDYLGLFLGQAGWSVSVYLIGSDLDLTDAMGMRGLLNPIEATLLAVGLVIAVRRFMDWRYALVVLVMLSTLIPLMAYVSIWGDYRRVLHALPVAFAAMGFGADALARLAERLAGRPSQSQQHPTMVPLALLVVTAGVIIASAAGNLRDYVTWSQQYTTRWVFADQLVQASNYLHSLAPAEPHIYSFSYRWRFSYSSRRFVGPDLPAEDRGERFGDVSTEWNDKHVEVVFLLLEQYVDLVDEIQALYPGGTYTEHRDRDGRISFVAYHVRRGPDRRVDRKPDLRSWAD